MWTIDKQFNFCYGHRVWSQQLNSTLCERGDIKAKCRHLHGHEGLVHVFLESNTLQSGMVTDFKHLGWVKNFIDDNLDHKFIIDLNDPNFNTILAGDKVYTNDGNFTGLMFEHKLTNTGGLLHKIPIYVPETNYFAGYILDVSSLIGVVREFYEGFFIVDFVPTSENLSKWIFDCVQVKMNQQNVHVSRIDWWETPKSRSTYTKV